MNKKNNKSFIFYYFIGDANVCDHNSYITHNSLLSYFITETFR